MAGMNPVLTYWQTEGGLTHLSYPGIPSGYTLCGRSTASMTLGDETISGIASDCPACRRQSPAGPMPDAPEPFTERRARYLADMIRWLAINLRVPAQYHHPPKPVDYGLTDAQGANARGQMAEVLDHRADGNGGRIGI